MHRFGLQLHVVAQPEVEVQAAAEPHAVLQEEAQPCVRGFVEGVAEGLVVNPRQAHDEHLQRGQGLGGRPTDHRGDQGLLSQAGQQRFQPGDAVLRGQRRVRRHRQHSRRVDRQPQQQRIARVLEIERAAHEHRRARAEQQVVDVGAEFQGVLAARPDDDVGPLQAALVAVRIQIGVAAEFGHTLDADRRPEWIDGVHLEHPPRELEAKLVERGAAQQVRVGGGEGVVPGHVGAAAIQRPQPARIVAEGFIERPDVAQRQRVAVLEAVVQLDAAHVAVPLGGLGAVKPGQHVIGLARIRRRRVGRQVKQHRQRRADARIAQRLRRHALEEIEQRRLLRRGLQQRLVAQNAHEDRLAPAQQFVGQEYECLVPPQRAAQGEPRLVAVELGLLVGEEIARLDRLVAMEQKDVAVPVVGARLGGDVDHPGRSMPELGLVAVGIHLVFQHGFLAGRGPHGAGGGVHVVHAIDGDRVAAAVLAAERQAAARQLLQQRNIRIGFHHPRGQQRELQEIAAVDGQVADVALGDGVCLLRPQRLHHGRRPRDFHLLLHGGHFQPDIHRQVIAHAHRQLAAHNGGEAFPLGLDLVLARRQKREVVGAVGVAGGGARQTGGGPAQGQLRAGQHRAAGVVHHAADFPRGCARLAVDRRPGPGQHHRQICDPGDTTGFQRRLPWPAFL